MIVGDTSIELHHARGETDDHLWAWFPDRKWIMAGDRKKRAERARDERLRRNRIGGRAFAIGLVGVGDRQILTAGDEHQRGGGRNESFHMSESAPDQKVSSMLPVNVR